MPRRWHTTALIQALGGERGAALDLLQGHGAMAVVRGRGGLEVDGDIPHDVELHEACKRYRWHCGKMRPRCQQYRDGLPDCLVLAKRMPMTEAFGVGGLLSLGGAGLRMIRSEMRMNWLPQQSIT